MNTVARSVMGIALSAGAMYMLDPVSGHRRRLIVRDQCTRAARRVEIGTREARKVIGMQAKLRFGQDQMSDRQFTARIRDALGRAVSHPRAIDVAVHGGHVILRGDVFAHEHEHLLDAIRDVRGVSIVTDHVTDRERARERSELTRSGHEAHAAKNGGWTLTSRLLVGTAGCAMLVWGIRQRKTLGSLGSELGELGQTLWRTAKHEIDENLANVKSAIERGESALDAARDAARDVARDVEDEAEAFGPIRRPQAGKTDSHAHVA